MKKLFKISLGLLINSLIFLSYPLNANTTKEENWQNYKYQVIDVLPKLEGWCSKEKANRMMDLVHKTKPAIYVEIGVFGGSSFLPTTAALEYENFGAAYAIDPWENIPCLDGNNGTNADWWSKIDLEKIYNGFTKSMNNQGLQKRYTTMRLTSKDALKFFTDESIDILHIDGNHSEQSALFDAQNWLKKVRSGGYIWFDDANWPSTRKAINYLLQFCTLDPSSNLNDSYILLKKN